MIEGEGGGVMGSTTAGRRRTTRAGVELSGAREWVPRLRLHCAAARALSLALVISASVTRRRPTSSSSVDRPLSLPLPPSHSLYLTPAGLVPISSSA